MHYFLSGFDIYLKTINWRIQCDGLNVYHEKTTFDTFGPNQSDDFLSEFLPLITYNVMVFYLNMKRTGCYRDKPTAALSLS